MLSNAVFYYKTLRSDDDFDSNDVTSNKLSVNLICCLAISCASFSATKSARLILLKNLWIYYDYLNYKIALVSSGYFVAFSADIKNCSGFSWRPIIDFNIAMKIPWNLHSKLTQNIIHILSTIITNFNTTHG